jgi:hypothetical protein
MVCGTGHPFSAIKQPLCSLGSIVQSGDMVPDARKFWQLNTSAEIMGDVADPCFPDLFFEIPFMAGMGTFFDDQVGGLHGAQTTEFRQTLLRDDDLGGVFVEKAIRP